MPASHLNVSMYIEAKDRRYPKAMPLSKDRSGLHV